jgi:hypothetical protein
MAELTFDQPGNFVVLDNDDARWLAGDLPDPAAEPAPEPGVRRLSAVPADDDQLTLGDDVLGIADEADGPESTLDLTDTAAALREGLQTEQPLEAFLDDLPALDESEPVEEDPEPEPPRRPVRKTRGRASVPSWDEIMFGGPSDGGTA